MRQAIGRRWSTRALAVAAVTALTAAGAMTAVAGAVQPGDWLSSSVFARVGPPGQPEGIAVARDGTVYVGTNQGGMGPHAEEPSKVFAFGRGGRPARSYAIESQTLGTNGLLGMALDGAGVLYVVDHHPARVIALDPRTGRQRTYAQLRDVPICSAVAPGVECSAAQTDFPPFPNHPVFAPDGTLYVTDVQQHLIWRIPPGGEARVWFTDPGLDTFSSANGMQFRDRGRTLVLAQTLGGATDTFDLASAGRLLTLDVRPDGRPGRLRTLWTSQPGDAPDGLAIGHSGRIYVALAIANTVVVIAPDGRELARAPANPALGLPFDAPSSVAFQGRRLLATNQSFLTGTPAHWAVLAFDAGERGRPLFTPRMPGAG